jgi:hypothetical protein
MSARSRRALAVILRPRLRADNRISPRAATGMKHFPAKETPVRRGKNDQTSNLEHVPIPQQRDML